MVNRVFAVLISGCQHEIAAASALHPLRLNIYNDSRVIFFAPFARAAVAPEVRQLS